MARPRTNKSTIGNDPFSTIIPALAAIEPVPDEPLVLDPTSEPPPSQVAEPKPDNADRVKPKPSPVPEPAGKQKLTIHLEASLVNRVKNAAYWNPRLTIAKIAEQGIRHALERVEKEHGSPYPARESELVGGRPIK